MAMENKATTDHYDLLGYRLALSISDAAVRAAAQMLRGFRVNADSDVEPAARYAVTDAPQSLWSLPVGAWHISVNDIPTEWYRTTGEILIALERLIVINALIFRSDLFHLHGAALASPSGDQGVLLIGESGSGKTTLALALMLRGFLAYSDDVAVIAPTTLALEPFPRAFQVDASTRALVAQLGAPSMWDFDSTPGYFVPPHGAVAQTPTRIVLFLDRQPNTVPHLVSLPPAEAARMLLMNALTIHYTRSIALATAVQVIGQARCYQLQIGDLRATVEMITALVAGARDDDMNRQ